MYDVSTRHSIQIAATPALVYQAARHADLGSPLLVRLLMGIRIIPAWFARLLRGQRRWKSPVMADCYVGPTPFTLVAERPGEEFVLGVMGRFWTTTGEVVATTAERYREPPPAGLAQGFWNFRVSVSGSGTELSTETRVRCSDEVTRRQFARYWRIIRPGSSLIRNSMLRHIRRVAEQHARSSVAHL